MSGREVSVALAVHQLTIEEDGHVGSVRATVRVPADVRAQLDRLGPDGALVEDFVQDLADCAVWLGATDAITLLRGDAAPYRRSRAGFRERE